MSLFRNVFSYGSIFVKPDIKLLVKLHHSGYDKNVDIQFSAQRHQFTGNEINIGYL